MAVELEVKTFAEKSVRMPLFTGYMARGLALHVINMINPSLAQDLHEPNAIKPYSVTPLYFKAAYQCVRRMAQCLENVKVEISK